jgi:iron complex outermembrane receptor protein
MASDASEFLALSRHPVSKQMKFSILPYCILFSTTLLTADESIQFNLSPFPVRTSSLGEGGEDIPGAAIRLQRPADLAEMLAASSASVQLVRRGGASNDLRLSGMGGDDVNVIQDGQRIYCACPSRMDPPASHTETTAIERIEVISGAFDMRYAGALGGTIELKTRHPGNQLQGEFDLSLGSFDFRQAGFAVEDGTDSFAGLFSGTYAESGVYKDGAGRRLTDLPDATMSPLDNYLAEVRGMKAYTEKRLAGKLSWSPDAATRHLFSIGYRRADDVLYPALRMDSEFHESISLALQSDWNPSWRPVNNASLNIYYNSTDHDMTDRYRVSSTLGMGGMVRPAYVLERGWFMQSLAEASTGGLHLELSGEEAHYVWRSGLEAVLRTWDINNRLGAGMTLAGPGMEISNDMIPDTRSLTLGAFGEMDWRLRDDWTLSLGLRLDRFTTEKGAPTPTLDAFRGSRNGKDTDLAVSGKAVLRYRVSERLSLYGGIGHTARPPNTQERYLNLQRAGTMPNWVGNPDLAPPRMTELTLGGGWTLSRLVLSGRAYLRSLEDYIYPERTMSGSKPIQTFTAIEARVYGFETTVSAQLDKAWKASAGATWQEGRKETQPLNNLDRDLAEIPGLSLRGQLEYRRETWFGQLELHYFGGQSRIDTQVGEQKLDAATVVHLRAGFDAPFGGTVLVGIENVFDRTFSRHNAYVRNPFGSDAIVTEPGRNAYLRYQIEF